jgi:nucleotide-binding universal stress UspA family protein
VIPPGAALLVPQLYEDQEEQQTRRKLEILSQRQELRNISSQTELGTGPVAGALADVVRRENIDLVVMGTHGRGGFQKLMVGSVTEELVRLASCAVVTVGPNAPATRPDMTAFHNILFVTSFGAASENAMPYALFFAKQSQAKLTLLHVLLPTPVYPPDGGFPVYHRQEQAEWRAHEQSAVESKLEKLIPRDTVLGCEIERMVTFDFLFNGILKAAEEKKPDLIVMGAHPMVSGKVMAHLPGTAVHQVMCHANCPVLTARA